MRKHYLDNLRWLAVLFLFPYHTARIFDGTQSFYIKGTVHASATAFVMACDPWFMPLLFAIAGISARYALEKRSGNEFLKDRIQKLLLPFVAGTVLLIPMQTYYAERFYNRYNGSYLAQYLLFFTKSTDLSGYRGGFTPGQLWFVLYLFLISLVSLPLLSLCKKKGVIWTLPNSLILPLFAVTFMLSYVGDIAGKSIGEYLSLFLLGYFVLSEDTVQAFVEKWRYMLLPIGLALTIYTVVAGTALELKSSDRFFTILTSWFCILAIMGIGRHSLNFQNKLTGLFASSSFSFYLVHQSWIVMLGFYSLLAPWNNALRFLVILIGSFLGSVLSFLVFRRLKITRILFAVRAR